MRALPDGRRGSSFLTAVLVLAVLGALASVVLWRHGIRARIERDRTAAARWAAIRIEPVLSQPTLASAVHVVVLADSASDRWFNGPATRDTIDRAWTDALHAIGADARVVPATDTAALRTAAVVVVPSAPCLSQTARRAVDGVLARGGGVIATWLTGTRDGACGDAGYHFITRISLATRVDTLDPRPTTHVTFPDGGVLAAGMPPAATIELRSDHDAAVRQLGRDGYYSDGMLNPAPAVRQPGVDGAVTHGAVGNGRAVYWGFDLSRVADKPWDRNLARVLLRNSIEWAAGMPSVSLAPWPTGRAAALVLVEEVDSAAPASTPVVRESRDALDHAGVHATFLLATSTVHDDPDLARSIAERGEVAARPDDELRIARTESEQTDKFRDLRGDLGKLLGRDVSGMMPPMERLDPLLTLAWVRAGGGYLFAGNGARSAAPELLTVDGHPFVLLPRVSDDDAAALRRAALPASGRAADSLAPILDGEYQAALAKLRALGGLSIMRWHAATAGGGAGRLVVGIARSAAADSTIWIAPANEVAGWWMRRSRLAVTSASVGDSLTARVVNNGSEPVDGAVLRVAAPPGHSIAAVSGATRLAPRRGFVLLLLPRLEPGSTHDVSIHLGSGAARAR
ncbi:MAG: hypothetical protein ACJ79K_10465 [Gemmatimonadaceae bacterium]